MLVIRLKPVGKKHQISFRVVVAEKRSKLNGRYREDLGFYNPSTDKFSVNKERAKYWLSIGAQPSETVHNIFVAAGIIEGPKKAIKIKETKREEGGVEAENKISNENESTSTNENNNQ